MPTLHVCPAQLGSIQERKASGRHAYSAVKALRRCRTTEKNASVSAKNDLQKNKLDGYLMIYEPRCEKTGLRSF